MQNHPYSLLKTELETMKQELTASLRRHETEILWNEHGKRPDVVQYIKDDLDDVERALFKFQIGLFGIDEATGDKIPLKKLKVLPTARTEKDVYFIH
ncbi:TraR/DksA family transcriptional regulator [Bacillus songklensis]|uniref:TraR/DksA family transcriptional regulator n=1 Tax=Bacillus songklensis TaxID=1069116 RepID=A0ABV8AYI2_9BACI